jgi:hypothetical protein
MRQYDCSHIRWSLQMAISFLHLSGLLSACSHSSPRY